MIVCLAMEEHLRDATVDAMAWILIPIFVCGIIIAFYMNQKKEKALMFDNVQDLVQGQIETDVDSLKEAYNHFKSDPKI